MDNQKETGTAYLDAIRLDSNEAAAALKIFVDHQGGAGSGVPHVCSVDILAGWGESVDALGNVVWYVRGGCS